MNYDIFARFYDPVMGDRSDVIGIIESQIHQHHPQTRSVLELGCGTGSIIAGLGHHFEVAGIDQSPNMIEVARRKLPHADLTVGTIAGFDPGRTFDVIICVFDTINHLTRFSDWQKLFSSAQAHLGTQGLLIFDMNTIGRMRALAAMPTYTQKFGRNTMDMDITPISAHQVEWHITIEEPATYGVIQVYEEQVREASFPLAKVQRELTHRFQILESFDSNHQKPSDTSDRIYFTCRRLP